MAVDVVTVRSSAKINLTLEVGALRADGYHEICSIVQTVGLWDQITTERCDDSSITIECNCPELATSENLCVRAAHLLRDEFCIRHGCHIRLTKAIPMGAGLGGGSGNAAAALAALCRLWRVTCDYDTLIRISRSLGADVPLFHRGGLVMIQGIGEKLTPLGKGPDWLAVIVKPPVSVSTGLIYQRMDEVERQHRPDHSRMVAALMSGDLPGCASLLSNEMEKVVLADHAIVEDCKQRLINVGAIGASMSGSGSAVFGLFGLPSDAEHAARQLTDCGCVFVAPFVGMGLKWDTDTYE